MVIDKEILQKKCSMNYDPNISAVQDHYKTAQDVHVDHLGNNDLIFYKSKMEIIKLPFPCFVANINFKETMTRSKGVKLVAYGRHAQTVLYDN